MKRKLLTFILAGTVLTAASVTGCGKSASDAQTGVNTETKADTETGAEKEASAVTEDGADTESEAGTETVADTEVSGAVVRPLDPLGTAQDAMTDGGYSVSFTADDLVKTDDGYELTVEVYEYDRYGMDAIDNLTEGSVIQFCNKDITVDTVEKDSETGSVQINGGIENDGIDLMEEDGLYRTVTLDDYPVYYSVGKVTLPLSEDVTFEDQADQNQDSDLPAAELSDLPAAIENSDTPFNCNNTVITVRQEQIVQIIRYWVP